MENKNHKLNIRGRSPFFYRIQQNGPIKLLYKFISRLVSFS